MLRWCFRFYRRLFGFDQNLIPVVFQYFVGQGLVIVCAVALRGVSMNIDAETRRLCQLDVATDPCLEDDQIRPGHLLPARRFKESLKVFSHFVGEFRAAFVHTHDDSADPESMIDSAGHQVHGFQELAQSLQGEKVRLEGDEDLVGGTEGIEGQNAQRGGAVDEHEFVRFGILFDGVAENDLSADDAGEFDLSGGQIDM